MPRFHFEIKRQPRLIDLLFVCRLCILCARCPISFIPFDAFVVCPFVGRCVCVRGRGEWLARGHIRWLCGAELLCLPLHKAKAIFPFFCVARFFVCLNEEEWSCWKGFEAGNAFHFFIFGPPRHHLSFHTFAHHIHNTNTYESVFKSDTLKLRSLAMVRFRTFICLSPNPNPRIQGIEETRRHR